MDFSEANGAWREVPSWAEFLMEFGFGWMSTASGTRRIGLISMPSESAAAGLVSLGAMRKCLEIGEANDLDTHYQRILSLAKKVVEGTYLRHVTEPGKFHFDEIDKEGKFWVKKVSKKWSRRTISRTTSPDWSFVGEAHVALQHGDQLPNSDFYVKLVKRGGQIMPSNLSVSYSGLCLAGHAIGEAATRAKMSEVRFRENGTEATLRELLTVQEWMPGTISRVKFYNSRTEELDRRTGTPQLVVADGDLSFLKVLNKDEFEGSDIVGVVHRTMERDKLEKLGDKLASLRQWYDPDLATMQQLPERPAGVATAVFRKRA